MNDRAPSLKVAAGRGAAAGAVVAAAAGAVVVGHALWTQGWTIGDAWGAVWLQLERRWLWWLPLGAAIGTVLAAMRARWPGRSAALAARSGAVLGALVPAVVAGAVLVGGDVPAAWSATGGALAAVVGVGLLARLLRTGDAPLWHWGAAAIVVAVAFGAVRLAAWWPAWSSARPNVLVVVVDCLRADHLSAYGYPRSTSPFLSRLAEHGTRFDRAYSTGSWTKASVASILTGLPPQEHRAFRPSHVLATSLDTLAERLGGAGYHTVGLIGGNQWVSEHFGMHAGYQTFRALPGRSGDVVVGEWLDWLNDHDDGRPWYSYVHFMDVHVPYSVNPYNHEYVSATGLHPHLRPGYVDNGWIRRLMAAGLFGPELLRQLHGVYDGQIRFVDAQIERMVRGLDERDQLARTLVLVTADHGEELGDHGNFEHGFSLFDEVVHVPMILAGPGVPAGTAVSEPVSLIDVAPTVLAAAGLDALATSLPGEALDRIAHAPDPRRRRPLPLTSTLYERDWIGTVAGRERLLERLPRPSHEAWTLTGARPAWSRGWMQQRETFAWSPPLLSPAPMSLADAVAELRQSLRLAEEAAEQREIDEEISQQLRALGYVQ